MWKPLITVFTFNSLWQITEIFTVFLFAGDFDHVEHYFKLEGGVIEGKSYYRLGSSLLLQGKAEIAGFLAKVEVGGGGNGGATYLNQKHILCLLWTLNVPSVQLHLK